MRLSVIIPVYNEINTIRNHPAGGPRAGNLIVNDSHRQDHGDSAGDRRRSPHLKILPGRTGARHIRHPAPGPGDVVIIQDADLEYFRRIRPIGVESGKGTWCTARGFGAAPGFISPLPRKQDPHRPLQHPLQHHPVGHAKLQMFNAKILKSIPHRRLQLRRGDRRADFRKKLRVYEVPISYDGRSYRMAKLRWTDAFVLLYWLVLSG